ncbi:MAG: (2Fe-2S) ferredoxin domain-containing protein [Kiritimatiellales bacterium]|nr:(2Fe-2S) ferredoxin domain-containing protein [Kiritimatiellales bacterium]
MIENQSPYICHLFVCTNNRGGERTSCADGGSPAFKAAIKQEIADRGWKGRVRVSEAGCLGLCEKGPNIIIYPHKIWFSAVTANDLPEIFQTLEDIMGK